MSRQFAELDIDGDGIVSTADLAALLARPDIHYSEDLDAAAVIAEIDKNRDGKVTFEEFARFMAGNEPVVKSAAELWGKARAGRDILRLAQVKPSPPKAAPGEEERG